MNSKRAITPRDLLTLWDAYTAFKVGQIAHSTAVRDYRKIRKRIVRLVYEAPEIEDAIAIRNWLMCEYASETARRTLVQFNACCKWAKDSEMLDVNPMDRLSSHIRPAPPGPRTCTPFKPHERDAIIAEFEEKHPFYLPWVRFLFLTGCRPEEARALHWRNHIAGDLSEVLFEEAWPIDVDKPQATKNFKVTRFPANFQLRSLLNGIRPRAQHRDRLVFQGERFAPFDYKNFQTRYWKPLVEGLVKQGKVAFYLPQYHARHTFITLALNRGLKVEEVAYLVRASPTVIWQRYVGLSKQVTVPEL